MEFAALGCLLANLLALFLSFLAAWQSSSNQGCITRDAQIEKMKLLLIAFE